MKSKGHFTGVPQLRVAEMDTLRQTRSEKRKPDHRGGRKRGKKYVDGSVDGGGLGILKCGECTAWAIFVNSKTGIPTVTTKDGSKMGGL